MKHPDIHDAGKGRWKAIHESLGIPHRYLTGKNCDCPMCGGEDRFRWTNLNMRGGYYCNGCGPGTGVDLLMKFHGWDFRQAKAKVLEVIGDAAIELPKAGSNETVRANLISIWDHAKPLTGLDPVSKYLTNRGIKLREPPKSIRWHSRLKFVHKDGSRTVHHAMVAKFVGPSDVTQYTLHYTYIDDAGRKAVQENGSRKNAQAPIPKGGAVRLMASAETMGIAEGIETALSAHLLYDVPVWSALSAGGLTAFVPPPTCKNLIVFGDRDDSYTGEASAYALAHRLRAAGLHVDVRLPPEVGNDFNDMLRTGVAA
jgi:putative DNA primase/helicase